MEIARLVLEYVKALVWPVAAVTALVVLRRHIPHLVARMESWRIKAGAFEIEGTARAAEAVEKDFEAAQALAEPLGLALPDLELPEREFRPTTSGSKNLRALRANVMGLVEQVDDALGLEHVPDPVAGNAIRLKGDTIVLDYSPDVVDMSVRRLATATGNAGWRHLADGIRRLHDFVAQAMDPDLRARTTAILAQDAYDSARDLTRLSVQVAKAR